MLDTIGLSRSVFEENFTSTVGVFVFLFMYTHISSSLINQTELELFYKEEVGDICYG